MNDGEKSEEYFIPDEVKYNMTDDWTFIISVYNPTGAPTASIHQMTPEELEEWEKEKKEREAYVKHQKLLDTKREQKRKEREKKRKEYIKKINLYYKNKYGDLIICPICNKKLKFFKTLQESDLELYGYEPGEYCGDFYDLWRCIHCKHKPFFIITPPDEIIKMRNYI